MAGIWLIDGTVEVRAVGGTGDDLLVIADVDSMVSVNQKQEQKEFSGSGVVPKETHTIKQPATIKFQKCPFTKDQLSVLCGMTKDANSTLYDDTTASTKYSLPSTVVQRPEVELLIKGSDDLTGLAGEIFAQRAKLVNDFDFSLAVNEFSMQELEFLVLKPTSGDYISYNFENA